ncbi:MAG TPA: FadR/GntR family transcriptional regulator [Xanthobacteraceae bacterium]|jgi:GntR family transcriptional repressor for pyruvate dehydrogenase complex
MTTLRTRANAPSRPPQTVAPLPPLAPRSLAHALVERLSGEILSGRLAPGAQLPTEQGLIAASGVSRTVVREAIAALRAEGLVVTRQGAGAFVAEGSRRPFRIDPAGLGSLAEVLAVMELRTGIEVEAAGLAAERAGAADLRAIAAAYAAIERAIARGEPGIDEDFAFHRRIAAATRNPQFVGFLEYLGRFIIPRQTIRVAGAASDRVAYLRTFQKEHLAIVKALRARSVAKARAAMRSHLMNSRKRYQRLVAQRG